MTTGIEPITRYNPAARQHPVRATDTEVAPRKREIASCTTREPTTGIIQVFSVASRLTGAPVSSSATNDSCSGTMLANEKSLLASTAISNTTNPEIRMLPCTMSVITSLKSPPIAA